MTIPSDIQKKIKGELEKYPNIKFIIEGNLRLFESLTRCRYQLQSFDHDFILSLSTLIQAHPRCVYQLPNLDDLREHLSEITLAGVLFGSFKEQNNPDNSGFIIYGIPPQRQFTRKLENLEKWLSCYEEYRTEGFGKKINLDFINYYTEIQFYNELIRFGWSPFINIPVGAGATNLDFKINFSSSEIFIEVTTPLLSRKYEEQITENPENCTRFGNEFGFFNVMAIIRDTICDKIRKQFKNIGSDENCIVLVINVENLMTPFGILCAPEKIFEYLFSTNFPKYVYGLILFSTDQSRFFLNPRYSLSPEETKEFQKFCNDENNFKNRLTRLAYDSC
ncbi:hypothetical protein [uncultured Methanoregula sp.]|uniref:hypothetical protein n=1 Tax=uncultured Methanoregula sp. TaxID=1005933 RepID=UPI002AABA11F|nr:hypothetical protein [uncultured Methanoregula sp.]